MGLDITAWRGLTRIDPTNRRDETMPAPCGEIVINRDFPDHAEGIEQGWYTAREAFSFRAGSYGGYNDWREWLAKLAGYPAYEPQPDETGLTHPKPEHLHTVGAWRDPMPFKPFWWLINFSDCEGVIGPVVSKILARDFAAFQPQVDAVDHEYYRYLYGEWRHAFELAADHGAVEFH